MKRYDIECGSSGIGWVEGNREGEWCKAKDVADLEQRLSDAVDLIAKLRAGVERYSSDLCREADDFLAEEER